MSQVEDVRSMVGLVPRPGRLQDAVWGWLETHWNVVGVVVSVTVAAVLVVTAALPPLLAPFVLGPLGAVIVTALIAPKGDPARTSDATMPAEARRPH